MMLRIKGHNDRGPSGLHAKDQARWRAIMRLCELPDEVSRTTRRCSPMGNQRQDSRAADPVPPAGLVAGVDVPSRRYPHRRTPTCLEGGGISWSRPILERPKARGRVVIRRSCGLNVVGVPPSPMWRVVCPSPRGGKRACRARSVVVGRLDPYMGGRDAGAPVGRRLGRRGDRVCRL